MPKRGLCCRPVSVRLSVTLVDCIHTAEDIVKLRSQPGSTIILVFFWPSALVPNSKGTPSAGAQNTRWVGKFLRFSIELAVYLGNGTRQAHGWYGTLIGSHMRSIEW